MPFEEPKTVDAGEAPPDGNNSRSYAVLFADFFRRKHREVYSYLKFFSESDSLYDDSLIFFSYIFNKPLHEAGIEIDEELFSKIDGLFVTVADLRYKYGSYDRTYQTAEKFVRMQLVFQRFLDDYFKYCLDDDRKREILVWLNGFWKDLLGGISKILGNA